jgi:uncharacterized protein YkwD
MKKGLVKGVVVVLLLSVASIAPGSAEGSLLAPPSSCQGQKSRGSGKKQERAMRCLLAFARARTSARRLGPERTLAKAAERKARDIATCGLSHNACGREAAYWAQKTGYLDSGSWRWGEVIALKRGKRASPRGVMKAWLRSRPHRETLLKPYFDDAGIGVRGRRGSAIWVVQFGCRGCA